MSEMLEKILSNENIRLAKKRVYANKGAGGVDGVAVQAQKSNRKTINVGVGLDRPAD